jgi:hypothetical protein
MKVRLVLPFLILDVYATLLVLGGVFAFTQAPAGANASTALIIPTVAALLAAGCAVVVLLGQTKPLLWKAGAWSGIVLAIVLSVAFAMPASRRGEQLVNYPEALKAFEEAKTRGESFDDVSRKAFFRERSSPDHDTTYLVRTLWSLTALSGLVVMGLVVSVLIRPREPGAVR